MSKTIVFFGNERIATGVTTDVPVLRSLVAAGYDVACIVANEAGNNEPERRRLEVQSVAEQYRIPILFPRKPSDVADRLRATGAAAGVLVAYGKIVPQSIIDLFPRGIVNLHPSLLPRHRGPTPLESSLLAGEQRTGVSIMQLVKAMDAGPVYAQAAYDVVAGISKQQLADDLLRLGADELIRVLPGILSGEAIPEPQNDQDATYDNLIRKEDGELDFSKSAVRLEREIRAFAGWPKSRTKVGKIDAIITATEAETDNDGPPGSLRTGKKLLAINCAEGRLRILSLKPAGKAEMSAEAFLAGHGSTLTHDQNKSA